MPVLNKKSQLSITGNVELYELPADFTYSDFEKLDDKKKYLIDIGDNLGVDSGLQQIILLMVGSNTNSFTLCGVGTGTSTPVSTDTALGTSLGTNTINSRYRVGNTAYFNTFFGKNDENGSWTETGIFTAGSVMLCRRKFSSTFVKSTSNSAVVSWSVSLTATADA
jgi:hypothetical protein